MGKTSFFISGIFKLPEKGNFSKEKKTKMTLVSEFNVHTFKFSKKGSLQLHSLLLSHKKKTKMSPINFWCWHSLSTKTGQRNHSPTHRKRHMNTQFIQRERRGKYGSHSPNGHRCFEKLPQTILILCLLERQYALTLLHKPLTQSAWGQMYFQI